MRATVRPLRRARRLPLPIVLAALLVACQAVEGTPTPAASVAGASASVVPPASSATPTATPAGATNAPLQGLVRGALATVVSGDLRVRSRPEVSEQSVRYTPLLALGTRLVVVAGPVEADGYTWFRVAPMDVKLSDNADQGWVAIADKDGTPWVALADDPTPGFELAAATITPPGSPDVAAARSRAEALNAFGIDLYRRMLDDPELALDGRGVVVSPASVASAIAMARAGAAGATADEVDAMLGADGWDSLGSGLRSLDAVLRARDAAWPDEQGGETTHQLALRTANMAFGQRGYPLEPAYLDRIGETFGAGLGLVDYVGDAGGARDAINGWVGRQTLGRIPRLLGDDDVTEATRIVLVNAIYLKAEWAHQFPTGATADGPFSTDAGTSVTVPMMQLTGDQDVVLADGDGWQATELDYAGPDSSRPLAMTLVLPDDLDAFEASLAPGVLADVGNAIAAERRAIATVTEGEDDGCGTYPYNVELSMPRFGIDTRANLIASLKALGMRLAFQPGAADFSGITTADALHIGLVVHQANIDVDEHGTEAAAATAVGADTGGCLGPSPATTRELRLDRPFLFLLRDVETNAVLFMGRVVDPSRR